ncbi:MAG: response regulator transcription factor [Candidatus Gastranaerophilales bacterium]|nr:response regulator transcription factor [Candidatus Gastranaerophilales bacterium]
MDKIKVLLVEDHTMTRLGLSLVLAKSENIELIGEAEDGKQGVELAKKLVPDVILMDIGLPYIDGIEATGLIKKDNLGSKILIFTSRDSEEDVFSALKAGADGYIMKGASETQMISAITAVNEGTAWLDPAIARLVLSNVQRQNVEEKPVSKVVQDLPINSKNPKNTFGLTDRELEVLALIVEGLSNPQIADRLVITRATAKAHVHSILQKLYVADRTQAAVYAMKEGLV